MPSAAGRASRHRGGDAGLHMGAVVYGAIVSVVLALVVATGLGIMANGGHVSGLPPAVLQAAGILCLAVGAALGARRAYALGWVHGGLTGVVVGLLGFLIGLAALPGDASAVAFVKEIVLAALVGGISGIVGVNL